MKILFFGIILTFTLSVPAQKKVEIDQLRSNFVKIESVRKRNIEFSELVNRFSQIEPVEIPTRELSAVLNEIDIRIAKDSLSLILLRNLMEDFDRFSHKMQRKIISSFVTIAPDSSNLINSIYKKTNHLDVFAVTAANLITNNFLEKKTIFSELTSRFNSQKNSLLYKTLISTFSHGEQKALPPLIDLLSAPFQDGKTVIFSFFRKDRTIPGLTIIRRPDGSFVSNPDGSLFSIPQLALSVNNLPWFLQDGNTPQGIYSVVGWYITPTESIGPTPNILTRIPFEVLPQTYFHSQAGIKIWDIQHYLNLLPVSWREFKPIRQAYTAGKLGRKLIIMHGSTDDPAYYENEPYFPLSPSKGCITSTEIWEPKSGRCVKSDQAKLMTAYHSTGERQGFLVVLELGDKKEPVSVNEVKSYIREISN